MTSQPERTCGGHAETLRLLATLYDSGDRGNREVEVHLRAHGWEYIGDHWMGPEEIARVTRVCKHCGERFEPFDPWATGRSSVANDCFEAPRLNEDHEMHRPGQHEAEESS